MLPRSLRLIPRRVVIRGEPPPFLPSALSSCRCITAFPAMRIASFRRIIAEKMSNRYSEARAKEIGPDLAALEWLMNCGATQVEMADGTLIGSQREMRKYVQMAMDPSSSSPPQALGHGDIAFAEQWPNAPKGVHILRVDASDSAIANEGFKYLKDVRRVEKLKLNFCDYFGDEALRELALGRPATTLQDVEIVLNPCLSDGALFWLAKMKSLRRAHFYFLPYVTNRTGFIRSLKLALPRCIVTFPEVSTVGFGYEDAEKEKKQGKR